jgi:Cu2+-containing amine oxidase
MHAQVNVEALPDGPENPYGNGFIPVETDLTSELKAQRLCDPSCARLWKIKNPESLHPVTGGARLPTEASSALCAQTLRQNTALE